MNKKDLMILMIQTTSLMSYYIIILVNSVDLQFEHSAKTFIRLDWTVVQAPTDSQSSVILP